VPSSPRVTVVTSRLDVGGTERHLTRILPALRQRGVDISLYVMERGGPLEPELVAQGVRVEGPSRARFLHWPRATLQLARYLRRERPTIVHFFLPRPYLYGSVAAEIAGQRRRIMSRRSLANYMTRHRFASLAEKAMHRRCLALIGNSTAVVEQLSAECGNPKKVALLHNGIEIPPLVTVAERGRIRQKLKIESEAIVIAVVANLIPYKGHRDLIEALSAIRSKMPGDWRVLMIGRDEGIGRELKARTEALGLADHVIWLGEQPQVEDLLRASDIFVLPSHEEGFSNALLEAMANGIAPVATAVGGNLDAVMDDETGRLVNAHDPAALGDAILQLAGDAVLRNRLGAVARQRVVEHFSFADCISRYEALYQAIGAGESSEKPTEIPATLRATPSARARLPASARPR
jgi:glycosyltransferase involved in cell wall biosynthesis